MKKRASSRVLIPLALLIVLGVAAPSFAQGAAAEVPRAEVGVAYQFVRFLGDFEENFPLGLNVDVGVPLGATMFSVVGEFGWVRDSDEIGNRDVNVDLLNFGGGVRVSYRDVPNVVPFGQVIFGGQRNSDNLSDESSTDFMFGVDGGVDITATDTWGFFGQFGYRRVEFEVEGANAIRFLVGARLRIP